ncbi:MAG: hypothetical protein IKT30_00230 [Bacteroidaceae bacterium]|nr:hypothetical protein [Bacteroidaceae bacterium]
MKIKFIIASLLLLVGFSSCQKDEYEYIPAEAATNAQVYFPTTNASQLELGALAGTFNLEIARIDSTKAMDVAITVEPANENYVFPATVSFEAGKSVAKVPVSYTGLEYDKFDEFTIKIDESAQTPYGVGSFTFKVGCPAPWTAWTNSKSAWVAAGNDPAAWPMSGDAKATCNYTYKIYWSGVDGNLDIFYRQSTVEPSQAQFKITNWGSGVDLLIDYNTVTGECQVPTQFAAVHSTYGDVFIADIPHYSSKYTYAQFPCVYDKTTGLFQLNVAYFCSAGMFGNDVETIQVNGYYIPDYSVDAQYLGIFTNQEQQAFAQIALNALGADAEKAVALVVTAADDATAVADALAAGEVTGTDLVAGYNNIAIEEGMTGELQVVVASVVEGAAMDVQSYSFEYYGGGANPWTSLGVGYFTDDIVAPLVKVAPPTYEVEICENTEKPGVYRIMNPYSNSVYPLAEDDAAPEGLYLEVNAEDPNGVYVPYQALGFDWGVGEFGFESIGANLLASGSDFETLKGKGYLGSVVDGVIKFPLLSNGSADFQGYVYGGGKLINYAGMNNKIEITLPSANAFAKNMAKAKAKVSAAKIQKGKISAKKAEKMHIGMLPRTENFK